MWHKIRYYVPIFPPGALFCPLVLFFFWSRACHPTFQFRFQFPGTFSSSRCPERLFHRTERRARRSIFRNERHSAQRSIFRGRSFAWARGTGPASEEYHVLDRTYFDYSVPFLFPLRVRNNRVSLYVCARARLVRVCARTCVHDQIHTCTQKQAQTIPVSCICCHSFLRIALVVGQGLVLALVRHAERRGDRESEVKHTITVHFLWLTDISGCEHHVPQHFQIASVSHPGMWYKACFFHVSAPVSEAHARSFSVFRTPLSSHVILPYCPLKPWHTSVLAFLLRHTSVPSSSSLAYFRSASKIQVVFSFRYKYPGRTFLLCLKAVSSSRTAVNPIACIPRR